jgi:hypothetical protein
MALSKFPAANDAECLQPIPAPLVWGEFDLA